MNGDEQRIDTTHLSRLPEYVEQEFVRFCRELVRVYAQDIRMIGVYGSLARDDYHPERSDINALIIMASAGLVTMKKAVDHVRRAREHCKLAPFFLSPEDLETSTDVFPIKFLDMKEHYFVVYGRDMLKNLEIANENLRLRLEQEMKILMLELRQFYLQVPHQVWRKGAPPALSARLIGYFTSFLYLIKRILMLQGHEGPSRNEDLVELAAREYEYDLGMLKRLLTYKAGAPIVDPIQEAVDLSLAVESASRLVDRLTIS